MQKWRIEEEDGEGQRELERFFGGDKTVTISTVVVSIKGQNRLCDCLCDAA